MASSVGVPRYLSHILWLNYYQELHNLIPEWLQIWTACTQFIASAAQGHQSGAWRRLPDCIGLRSHHMRISATTLLFGQTQRVLGPFSESPSTSTLFLPGLLMSTKECAGITGQEKCATGTNAAYCMRKWMECGLILIGWVVCVCTCVLRLAHI